MDKANIGRIAVSGLTSDQIEVAIRVPDGLMAKLGSQGEQFWVGAAPMFERQANLFAAALTAMVSSGSGDKNVQIMDMIDAKMREMLQFVLDLH